MRTILFFFSVCCSFVLQAQHLIYQPIDSVKVELLLHKAVQNPPVNRSLFFGEQFLETPYVAQTLEIDGDKNLIVNTRQLDCTTFVENVLALVMTAAREEVHFSDFCKSLTQLRYRDGIRQGYVSRLHYFSDWIANNQKKGLVKDLSAELSPDRHLLTLNFMSTHANNYPFLKGDSLQLAALKKIEQHWVDYSMPYLSLATLRKPEVQKQIKDGDIIALVCTIKGLDLSHVGLAKWVDGKLHLLNASMLHEKVVVDSLTLCDYVAKRSSIIGVRVIRIQSN